MLSVRLDKVGKKFGREWIFRGIGLELLPGDKIVLLGGNGSGKSTLLQVISGFVTPNEGQLTFNRAGAQLQPEQWHRHVSLASPYLQLIEDLTAPELVAHLAHFKKFRDNMDARQVLEIAELAYARNKAIKQYSSGMKQRLKLALAFLSETDMLLLDEPLSNLDAQAMRWYRDMIAAYVANRIVVVCSNATEDEYFFCTRSLNLRDYKPSVQSI